MLSHRSRVANLRFTMNALRAPLSASPACVTMWPSRRRNACADERSLLTYWLVQRLGADHHHNNGKSNNNKRPKSDVYNSDDLEWSNEMNQSIEISQKQRSLK